MTTVTAELRQMSTDRLAELYCAGRIDLPALLAVDRADVAAGKARARQAAERAAWLDAAHAQYLQADRDCAGRLFSRAGMAAGIADALSLWRGSESWARRMASEELRNWWDDHGRLSLASYRRQQAMQRRAYRDERDLEAMPERSVPEVPERTAPAMRAPSARELAEQAAAAPRTAARPPGSIARYITALGHLQRQAEATARVLARVNGGIQR